MIHSDKSFSHAQRPFLTLPKDSIFPMKLTADLHIHSHYSRATSKTLDFPNLARWAQLKGVNIVGTGDISHPGWLAEMHENLEPAEPGLFRLKAGIAQAVEADLPASCRQPVRFLLAGEISSIYKKGDKTRKVHNVIFAPSLETVAKIQVELEKIGNIRSDGRPILGLPSRDLLEIILGVDERCHLIPAHIWTPWFSMLGSKSGYDSVEECFEDLTPHIFALETGLSSDPPMNWRVSNLDRYTLVSNSDAHSPPKLAREATLFDIEPSYDALFDALKSGDPARCLGTLEFFPEEGKYHHDGHRKCNVNWKPAVTLAHDGICSVCGKPVTVGVGHRAEVLADRPEGYRKPNAHPFYSIIPLPEIISDLVGVGPTSKRVQREYQRMLAELGSELSILLELPLEDIAKGGGEKLAGGIGRMRQGEVNAIAGYDGEYGIIKLFDGDEEDAAPQMSFFEEEPPKPDKVNELPPSYTTTSVSAQYPISNTEYPEQKHGDKSPTTNLLSQLNAEQRTAAQTTERPLIIVAGPGTGKTRTLTTRIAYLIQENDVVPESILAITFTNKAAGEMAERLQGMVGAKTAGRITIKTFHAFGTTLLRQYAGHLDLDPSFVILSDDDRQALAKTIFPDLSQKELNQTLNFISSTKSQLFTPDTFPDQYPISTTQYQIYESALIATHALDFDDLIALPVQLLESHPEVLSEVQAHYRWISVDEYQDINLAQYRLLRSLTAAGANLCVIGDPDQAIYGFRGADYRYFLQFEQDYPDALRLQLSQNYRSTQLILDAAIQVIARNPDRESAEIFSDFVDQVKLDVYQPPTDKAEAEYVVHQIEQMVGGTSYFSLDSGRVDDTQPLEHSEESSFGDFAVLYRLNALSRPLVEAFERSGIPYQTVGQTPFFAQNDVREALAHLWLLHNPASQMHREMVGLDDGGEEEKGRRGEGETVAEMVEEVGWRVGLPDEDLRRLVGRAQSFGTDLQAFLEMTVLGSETDFYDPRADRVTLMTLHAAKGLEFPVVFMVGCEEGLLPYVRSGDREGVGDREGAPLQSSVVEEERRLFYVGMTRAQQKLILLHARSRFLFGRRVQNPASRYVEDIEQTLVELKQMAGSKKKRKGQDAEQLSLF